MPVWIMLGGIAMLSGAAAGAGFPERPIRVLLPFPAGGNVDIMARTVAPGMSAQLGQSVIVDDRSGAHGTLAADFVQKAARDAGIKLEQ